jgi:hypothetical protein
MDRGADKMLGVGQRLLDKMAHMGVLSRVEESVSISTDPHQSSGPQLREVLRHSRWVCVDMDSELAHGMLAVQ